LPWKLDGGFKRRFQNKIYVDVPDSSDRLKLLQAFVGPKHFIKEEEWSRLVKECEGTERDKRGN
jgi:SpoVK/Ycf46/Vps4 family AAA+-type ATPase